MWHVNLFVKEKNKAGKNVRRWKGSKEIAVTVAIAIGIAIAET